MKAAILGSVSLLLVSFGAMADESHAIHQDGAILSAADASTTPTFDILAAHAHRDGRTVTFHMTTNGIAGEKRPDPVGSLGGAQVLSYVWPTSLDPSTVGFERGTGILALAATSHPDFDDTPLFDESGDNDPANDGHLWHSHWVVLTPNEACGTGALGVRDIEADATPAMPATWSGFPLFVDSPGYSPIFVGPEIKVTVPFSNPEAVSGASYDGVTSALQVNADVHAPLLCVTDVFDVASGDLSLPGALK